MIKTVPNLKSKLRCSMCKAHYHPLLKCQRWSKKIYMCVSCAEEFAHSYVSYCSRFIWKEHIKHAAQDPEDGYENTIDPGPEDWSNDDAAGQAISTGGDKLSDSVGALPDSGSIAEHSKK